MWADEACERLISKLHLGLKIFVGAVQVLKFYNLEGQSKWLNLLYETCFLLLFLILAW